MKRFRAVSKAQTLLKLTGTRICFQSRNRHRFRCEAQNLEPLSPWGDNLHSLLADEHYYSIIKDVFFLVASITNFLIVQRENQRKFYRIITVQTRMLIILLPITTARSNSSMHPSILPTSISFKEDMHLHITTRVVTARRQHSSTACAIRMPFQATRWLVKKASVKSPSLHSRLAD